MIKFFSFPTQPQHEKKKKKSFLLKKSRWIGILKYHWSQEKTWRGKRQASDLVKQVSSRDWLLHHRHCGLWEHWDSDTKWVQLGGIWRLLFRANGFRPLDEDAALRAWRRRKITRIDTKIRRPKPIFSRSLTILSQVTAPPRDWKPESETCSSFVFLVLWKGNYRTLGFSCVVKVVSSKEESF